MTFEFFKSLKSCILRLTLWFVLQLADKEARYMKTLSEEWKKRDKEREVLVKKKVEYYLLCNQFRFSAPVVHAQCQPHNC